MTKKKPPEETPPPKKLPEIEPPADPEEPLPPEEDPDIIPDDVPYEEPPDEVPPPGQGSSGVCSKMAFEKIILNLYLLVLLPFSAICQKCGTIDRNLTEKERRYYLLDTSHAELKIEPNDTALVRQIIQSGRRNEDYVGFFQGKGITTKKIGMKEFNQLPRDSVVLSRREKRTLKRMEKLQQKHTFLLVNEKPADKVVRKLGKKKFIKLHNHLSSSIPFLFAMWPIYSYQKYTLLRYSIYARTDRIPFIYEICTN